MDAAIVVPVVSVIVGSFTAIGVPYLTFAHNRKLERIRLMTAERGQVYVDALTEAYAEKTWVEHRLHARVYGVDDRLPAPADLRLSDKDRAMLGSRMGAYAEPAVLEAWNRFNAVAVQQLVFRSSEEGDLAHRRMELMEAMAALEAAVRSAMASD